MSSLRLLLGLGLVLGARAAEAGSFEDCALHGACCFPRSEVRSLRTPEPKLPAITIITVGKGGLSTPVVKRVLDQAAAALDACSNVKALVHVRFVVKPSGVVLIEPNAPDALGACAITVLGATRFPVSTGVTDVTLRVTWPGNDRATPTVFGP